VIALIVRNADLQDEGVMRFALGLACGLCIPDSARRSWLLVVSDFFFSFLYGCNQARSTGDGIDPFRGTCQLSGDQGGSPHNGPVRLGGAAANAGWNNISGWQTKVGKEKLNRFPRPVFPNLIF
jgi:hypothetical protein